MVELGTHPATERAGVETPHLSARAPELYPDSRTSGSVRGAGRKARPYRDRYALTIARMPIQTSASSTRPLGEFWTQTCPSVMLEAVGMAASRF